MLLRALATQDEATSRLECQPIFIQHKCDYHLKLYQRESFKVQIDFDFRF